MLTHLFLTCSIMTKVTSHLVSEVSTVVIEVTDIWQCYTAAIGTLELVYSAWGLGWSTTVLFLFVAAIATVIAQVAHEASIDTVAVVTAELGRHFTCDVPAQAEVLIGAITTVVKAITHPILANTQVVLALELVSRAIAAPWETSGA